MSAVLQFLTGAATGAAIPLAVYLSGRIAERRLDTRHAARRTPTIGGTP